MTDKEIVLAFVDSINRRDVDSLARMAGRSPLYQCPWESDRQ
jgi:hypothetical protein